MPKSSKARSRVASVRAKRKKLKIYDKARLVIVATFNNTLVTLTDTQGNTIASSSAGRHFKGARKSTPFAAQLAAGDVVAMAEQFGVKFIEIFVRGVGAGRDSALRALASSAIKVLKIIDRTRIKHGGCKSKKVRRV